MRFLETIEKGSSPVTLADLKSFLKIDDNSEDTILTMCLESATDSVQGYLKRVPVLAEFNLWLDAFPIEKDPFQHRFFNSQEIYLPFPPIINLKSIKTYNVANVETVFSNTKYQVDKVGGRIYLNQGEVWPSELRNLKSILVNYEAGYQENCPPIVKQAVLMQASAIYNDRCECLLSDKLRKMLSPYKIYDSLA